MQCVAFSSDGTTALTGSHDGTIRHWDLAQGQTIATFNNHGKVKAPVKDVYFTKDRQHAVVSNWGETRIRKFDDAVLVLNLEDGSEIRRFLTGHVVLSADISPSNRFLLTASAGVVTLWDFASGHAVLKVPDHHNAIVRFHPDERSFFVTSQSDGPKLTWYEVSEQEIVRETHPDLSTHYLSSMTVAPDGKRLIVADTRVVVIDLHDNQHIEECKPSGKQLPIRDLAISPDSKLLATVARDCFIRLWDLERGEEITSVSAHTDVILSAKFSPDGLYLLTGGGDHMACLWRIER